MVVNAFPRSNRLTNKKSQCKMWEIFIQIIHQGGPRATPRRVQTFAITLGHPPEPDDKTLLLKTSKTLVTEHSAINGTELEASPLWIVFIVPEGAMQTLGVENDQ